MRIVMAAAFGWPLIVIDVVLVCALAYGVRWFVFRPAPLYFRFMTCAVFCYTLSELLWTAYYFCYSKKPEGITLFSLGFFGCYLFMLSVNYGPMDSIIDDGNPSAKRARVAALAAPLILTLVSVGAIFLNPEAGVFYHTMMMFLQLPKLAASYYNLKHLLIKDENFGLTKAIRISNVLALVIYGLDMAGYIFEQYGMKIAYYVTAILIPVCLFGMLIAGKRGYDKWLT